MNKEIAVYLLGKKDVYLTPQGKKELERIAKEKQNV